MEDVKKSEIDCGNCEEPFEMDDNGDHIQPCPNCGSNEMVKGEGLDK